MDDLKQFRQWESKTPGHPENFLTEGVEVTTGAYMIMHIECPPHPCRCLQAMQRITLVFTKLSAHTGPLGQGVGNAVGLAAAEAHLAARFNKDDCKIVDHYTYCIMGDGCAAPDHRASAKVSSHGQHHVICGPVSM